jgi:hypothetical protein
MSDYKPTFDVKRLAKPTANGGAKAEIEYGDFHRKQGTQKLRGKYTQK